MGHLKLRKIYKAENMWIDKKAPKHKHNFVINCLLEQKSPNGHIDYFNILKCNQCKSFKSIPEKGNIQGEIFTPLTEEQKQLPKIKCAKKHDYLIGFYDIENVE